MPLGRYDSEDVFDTVEDFVSNWLPALPDYTDSNDPLLHAYAWRTDQAIKPVHKTPRILVPTLLQTDEIIKRLSSIGSLDQLPIELLHLSLEYLDFESLLNLAISSFQCRSLVESLSAFRETVQHAPAALAVLQETGLLATHTARRIHASLRDETCGTCKGYGPYIFVYTAKRCCLPCLRDLDDYQLVTKQEAEICFGLSPRDLTSLPAAYEKCYSA